MLHPIQFYYKNVKCEIFVRLSHIEGRVYADLEEFYEGRPPDAKTGLYSAIVTNHLCDRRSFRGGSEKSVDYVAFILKAAIDRMGRSSTK